MNVAHTVTPGCRPPAPVVRAQGLDVSYGGIDRGEAEAILSDVAATLMRLPFEGRIRSLHLRALDLKRRIGQWERTLAESDAQRTVRDILDLQSEATGWREILRGL